MTAVPTNDRIEARRVEWRRADTHAILVDLDTGRTVARWMVDGWRVVAQLVGAEKNESTHSDAESAERWCMEHV